MLSLIVAMGRSNRIIGLDGDMPWNLSADLKRFKKITTGHTVVMGRKTWESIPAKFRPLPNRQNIVLTRNKSYRNEVPEGVIVASSLDEAIELHRRMREQNMGENWGDIFAIGGESIFAEALPKAHRLYLTLVDYQGEGDTFFPEDPFFSFQQIQGEPWLEEVPADEKNTHTSWFCVMGSNVPFA